MAAIEDLDHSSSPVMFDTDLDVSEWTAYSHTLAKCLNKDLTLQDLQTPKEKSNYFLDSQPHTPSRAPSLPLLLSLEELASSPRIIKEILPEIWPQSSPKSSPLPAKPICESHNPQTETRTLKKLGAVSKIPVKVPVTEKGTSSTEDTRSSTTSLPKARPRSSKSRCWLKPSPGREEKQNQAARVSSGVPSVYRLDLSKVKSRVRFPKDGYTPPKSRHAPKSSFLSTEPSLVNMSPANRTTSVLLNPLDGPDPKAEEETPAALFIPPPEFSCKQQAISLMNELQEDNVRLKMKYDERMTTINQLRLEVEPCERSLQMEQQMEVNTSNNTQSVGEEETPAALSILPSDVRSRREAISLMNELQEENYRLKLKCDERMATINRLRLERKVNLYSEPKHRLLHCGVRTLASRPVALDSACPQRAAFSPSSSSQTRVQQQQQESPSISSLVRRFADLIDTLYSLAQLFLQNGEAYKRSLQTEQIEEMLQKLDVLERGYMFAKEEHKRLQREGAHLGSFDPERELESLIFLCDLLMDELNVQFQQKQLYTDALPTHHKPPTHHSPPSRPLQTPPTPSHAAMQVPQHRRSPSSSSSSVRGVAHRLQSEQQKCPSASALPGSPFTTATAEDKLQTTLPDPLRSSGRDVLDHTKLFHSLKEVCVPLVRELSSHSPFETSQQCEETRRLSKATTETPERSDNKSISRHKENFLRPRHSPKSSEIQSQPGPSAVRSQHQNTSTPLTLMYRAVVPAGPGLLGVPGRGTGQCTDQGLCCSTEGLQCPRGQQQ